MQADDPARIIAPTTGAKTLPVEEVLTGRGFATGKSGSGKSNTASVICELLLDNGYNLSVIDPEGEYYALNERYEILHVGAGEHCDVQVTPNEGERLAEITLTDTLPIVIDVSDFLTESDAQALVKNYVSALFEKEQSFKQPHLLVVEEMQEYLPQSGQSPPTADILRRIGKRGRKHGLGMLGLSQRPAAVDKEYITQCDWLVWHRLTWDNDVDTARKILGADRADELEGFDDGEAYLMTEWDDSVERVKFKRKKTSDAGATPGLDNYERRDMRNSTSNGVMSGPKETPDVESESASHESTEAEAATNTTDNSDLDSVVDDLDLDTQSPSPTPDAVDMSSLNKEELEKYATDLERRNEILRDEVAELRSLLENQSKSPDGTENSATPVNRDTTSESTPVRKVTKPDPPPKPRDRSGVAGNLVESVAMLRYLFLLLHYRGKLVFYSFRRAKSDDLAAYFIAIVAIVFGGGFLAQQLGYANGMFVASAAVGGLIMLVGVFAIGLTFYNTLKPG